MSLADQLKKMRATADRKPAGNVIVQVNEIGDTTMKGTIMTGAAKGTDIEFTPSGYLGIAEYKKGKSKLGENGTMRVEQLKEGVDGIYTCRWAKTFLAKPDAKHRQVLDQATSFSETTKRDSNGARAMFLEVLNLDEQKLVTDFDGMKTQMLSALKATGCVAVIGVEDGEMVYNKYFLSTRKVDGAYVTEDPEEMVEGLIGRVDAAAMDAALTESPVSVVPVSSYRLGSDTSANIDLKIKEREENPGTVVNIPTVDPASFKPLSIGLRTAVVLGTKGQDEIPQEYADRLEEQFLATASDAAKADFHKNGWRGVSDTHMKAFYESQGQSVTSFDKPGWAQTSIVLRQHDDNDAVIFATKSFTHGIANPYPPVEACQDLRAKFYGEIRDAVNEIGKNAPEVDAQAKVEKAAAKAAAKSADKAPAETIDEAMEDGVDDVLAALGGEGLNV